MSSGKQEMVRSYPYQPRDIILLLGLILLGATIALLPIQAVIALMGAAAGTALSLYRPWLVWPLLALALPFAGGLRIGPLSIVDLLFVAGVGLWFAEGVRRRSVTFSPNFPGGAALGFSGLLLLLTLGATNLVESLAEVIKWAEIGVIAWLVGRMVPPRKIQWIILALLVGGGAQAVLGLYQFWFQVGPDSFVLFDRFMRAAGSFGQPNPFAGYLGLLLPVGVSLTLWGLERFVDRNRAERPIVSVQIVLYALLTGLIGLGMLVSWSRGGWLGASIAILVVLTLRSRRAALVSMVLGLLVLLALLVGSLSFEALPAPIRERTSDLTAYLGVGMDEVLARPLTDQNFSVQERLAHWKAALRMWESAPWTGVGPGNYATVYPQVRLPAWEDPLGHAHNIYLNQLAEGGLIGLSGYLLFWSGMLVWILRRIAETLSGSFERALAVGVVGMIVHLSVHNLFDNLYVQGIYLVIGLCLGATAAARTESQ